MPLIEKRPSTDSSSSDDEIECPLTGAEALNVCRQFASATNTNTGLAMMMLQKNHWNLQQAIEAYQSQKDSSTKSNSKQVKNVKYFKVLSWNIDGLDEQQNTIDVRTRGVINVIRREKPEVVFLQEVIPLTLDLIHELLPNYEIHSGGNENYFVVILTLREHFKIERNEIIEFPGSKMGRNLLIVHTLYKDEIGIDLMTSHHESGKEDRASQERIEQLKFSWKKMLDAPAERAVIFGGDLNLREKEVQKAGDIPQGIVDVWVATGRRRECAFTWDMNRNTNLFFPSDSFRPRARFDRLFFRAASASNNLAFKPAYFELEGLEKLSSIKRYCSDHWAIQAYFDVSSRSME